MRTLQKIGWLLLLGVVLLLPSRVSAQFDASAMLRSQYQDQTREAVGQNPFDTGEEGAEQADSTQKEKRPRKPLESYFFNDSIRALPNFMWTIRRDYNEVKIEPLDTTLATWRIDYPFYKKGVGEAALGGLGQASLPYNYFERRDGTQDFAYSAAYDAYLYRMENVPFYNLKRPYFQFQYLESGQKRYREENFALTLAHNISPSTGVNVNYRARGTKGLYEWQQTKNHNLSVAVSHTGKRYSVHAGYVNNRMSMQENGGVVGEWAVRDTTFEMPSGVPMKLTNYQARNEYRNNAFFVTQSYGIPFVRVTEDDFSIARMPALFVGHSFEYNTWSKIYTDVRGTYSNERYSRDATGAFVWQNDLEYYANWFIDPAQSRDSLNEQVISNRLYAQLQPWDRNGVVGTLTGGVGWNLKTYSQFLPDNYATGRYGKSKSEDYFAYGSVGGKIKRYVDWDADAKYFFMGGSRDDYSIGGHLALTGFIRGKPLVLEGRFRTEMRAPAYWQEHLFTNHYVFQASLGKEKEQRFEVSFRMPDHALELGFWQSVLTDKIYYEYYTTDKNTAANGIPIQDVRINQQSGTTSITSLYARKDFRIAGLHLDHKVLVQWSTNQNVVPVPTLNAFLSYYYEFWAVRDVLRVQFGVDARYNTRYYAPGYNPALGQFYNQQIVQSGNYPYVDLFLVGKWKRARVFLKYQHINRGLFGNDDYFAITGYPLNPGMFKFGLSWGFYD